jgi:chaperonin GroES
LLKKYVIKTIEKLKLRRLIMNFIPVEDRILVKREEEVTKTSSGIFIPDSAKEKPQRGEVLAVAKKVKEDIKVGDTVVFSKYGAVDLVLDNEEYVVLKVEDILGVIKNK